MVACGKVHSYTDIAVTKTLHLAVDWQNRFLLPAQASTDQPPHSKLLLLNLSAAVRRFAASNISTLWVVTGARTECRRLNHQQVEWLSQRHDVPPEVAAMMRGWLLVKTRDSAFSQPHLLAALRQRGIRRLLLSGFQARHCIAATAQDATALGFECNLLSDIIGGQDNDAMQRHRQLCDAYGQNGTIGVQRLSCLAPGIVPTRHFFRRMAEPVTATQVLFRREQAALLA